MKKLFQKKKHEMNVIKLKKRTLTLHKNTHNVILINKKINEKKFSIRFKKKV